MRYILFILLCALNRSIEYSISFQKVSLTRQWKTGKLYTNCSNCEHFVITAMVVKWINGIDYCFCGKRRYRYMTSREKNKCKNGYWLFIIHYGGLTTDDTIVSLQIEILQTWTLNTFVYEIYHREQKTFMWYSIMEQKGTVQTHSQNMGETGANKWVWFEKYDSRTLTPIIFPSIWTIFRFKIVICMHEKCDGWNNFIKWLT